MPATVNVNRISKKRRPTLAMLFSAKYRVFKRAWIVLLDLIILRSLATLMILNGVKLISNYDEKKLSLISEISDRITMKKSNLFQSM